jgi:phage shock protein PspC (stress-responsive transcriptional regulator)
MPSAIESTTDSRSEVTERRLYRSNSNKVIAGVCGGLGEYFNVDAVWFRLGFVLLAIGGGSGILAYVLMWLIVQPAPDGYVGTSTHRGSIGAAAIVGIVLMIVGTVALVNTIAPDLGQYFWPVAFVMGGLALVVGGLSHDDHK